MNPERTVTPNAIERVFELASDESIQVRYEVAHALGKIGTRYPDRMQRCLEILDTLKTDPEHKVRERAIISIQRMPHHRSHATW